MEQRISLYKGLLTVFAMLCGAAAIFTAYAAPGQSGVTLAVLPFERLGQGLRALSLSGTAGNITAWAAYGLLSLLPLALPLWRKLKGKKLGLADGVCAAASAYLFFFWYLFVNPGYAAMWLMPQLKNAQMGSFMLVAGLLSFACAAAVLYLMGGITGGKVFAGLRALVVLLAMAGVFGLCYGSLHTALSTTITSIAAAAVGGMGAIPGMDLPQGTAATSLLAILRLIAEAAPAALLLAAAPPALRLLYALERDTFAPECASHAQTIARRVRLSLLLYVLCSLAFNLLQLLLSRVALSIDISVMLPLGQLAVATGMLLLSQYFAAGARLRQENDQFV